MKKRFSELEEKIRITLQEKEEAENKLKEFSTLLKETKESCEHAEMVVRQQSHRTSNADLPNNRRHYQTRTAIIDDDY